MASSKITKTHKNKDNFKIKTIVFPRTKGVSSKIIRKKASKIVKKVYWWKLIYIKYLDELFMGRICVICKK